MNGMHDYDALADAIKFSDITSKKENAAILSRIKDNDPSFTSLWLCTDHSDGNDYTPEGVEDMGWLGYFISKNTHLERLIFHQLEEYKDFIEPFCRGLSLNKSLKSIGIFTSDLSECDIFAKLNPLFKNNPNLAHVLIDQCEFRAEECRSLSLALGAGKNTLKSVRLYDCRIEDEHMVDIILALSVHPQLGTVNLSYNGLGRHSCTALATLLRWTCTELHTLDLDFNRIGDQGVEELAPALATSRHLHSLDLSGYSLITKKGWKALCTLLQSPSSNLETLIVGNNGIDDEVAVAFATALENNSTLTTMNLGTNNDITTEGWAAFAPMLCNSSSINKTYLSNHTLKSICFGGGNDLQDDVNSSLKLNRNENKKQVAMIKILRHHPNLNMKPFFQWDFKVLPLVIDWLEKAAVCPDVNKPNIRQRRLSAIYQFIRGMPAKYIEAGVRVNTDNFTE